MAGQFLADRIATATVRTSPFVLVPMPTLARFVAIFHCAQLQKRLRGIAKPQYEHATKRQRFMTRAGVESYGAQTLTLEHIEPKWLRDRFGTHLEPM